MENIDYATRAAILSNALKRAQAEQDVELPQATMQGGFAITPGMGGLVNYATRKALGNLSAGNREQELTALNDEQMQKFADISKQLTTPGTKTLKRTLNALKAGQEGPTGPEVEEQVPLDYSNPDDLTADNARRMGQAAQMAQLSLPQAKAVSQDYLSKGANFPDTLAKMRMQQVETGQQNAMRLQEAARLAAEREQGRNDRAAEANALRMTLKSMGSGGGGSPQIAFVQTVDEQGNPVTQVVDKRQLTPGTQFGKAPTSAERKAITEANIGVAGIDDALSRVAAAKPSSFGPQYAVPGAETAGQYLDKEGIEPRAVVSNIGSMKIHDRSGATVTVSEFPRLAPFIPKVSDNKAAIEKKLGLLKEEYGRIAKEWGRDPATKPGAARPGAVSDEDLLKKYK